MTSFNKSASAIDPPNPVQRKAAWGDVKNHNPSQGTGGTLNSSTWKKRTHPPRAKNAPTVPTPTSVSCQLFPSRGGEPEHVKGAARAGTGAKGDLT